ncbi:mRNA 3'-end-processing protein rna14 [Paramarasmius palmivorus]|uniref:mRNA 3'-end-processing protein RNA14 n=1 Tax=Paramarasmius palmivorus TaxID=297713 RepID=A0AAW0B2E5_9AGAR
MVSAGDYQALRKTLHEIVTTVPLEYLPDFWDRLRNFEREQHMDTSVETLARLTPTHADALYTCYEYLAHMEVLYPPPLLGPFEPASCHDTLRLPASPAASVSNAPFVRKWKAYLEWEESDPLNLRETDEMAYITRICSAYRKANTRMRFCPELWHMSYEWYKCIGNEHEALLTLSEGINGNRDSLLLNFALADTLEQRGDIQLSRRIYDDLLRTFRTMLKLRHSNAGSSKEFGSIYVRYMHFALRAEGICAVQAVFKQAELDGPLLGTVYEEVADLEQNLGAFGHDAI